MAKLLPGGSKTHGLDYLRIDSREGQDYLNDMTWCQAYAFQVLPSLCGGRQVSHYPSCHCSSTEHHGITKHIYIDCDNRVFSNCSVQHRLISFKNACDAVIVDRKDAYIWTAEGQGDISEFNSKLHMLCWIGFWYSCCTLVTTAACSAWRNWGSCESRCFASGASLLQVLGKAALQWRNTC